MLQSLLVMQAHNYGGRLKLLKENLRLDHLNQEEKRSVLNMCTGLNDIFYLPNDTFTTTKTIQHEKVVTNSILR